MKVIPAKSEDAGALTAVAFASKRQWGYPEEWIRRWADLLTVTPDWIKEHPTYCAMIEGRTVGFYGLAVSAERIDLEHLWVLPEMTREGMGRALFRHAVGIARAQGAKRMDIASDPNAVEFYRRMGASVCGHLPALMDDKPRFLTLLGIEL